MGLERRVPERRPAVLTRRAAIGGVLAAALVAGCGSREESSSPPPQEPDYPSVEPADFEALVQDSSTFVLNVHTPDEGTIPGTDAAIPYDQLRQRAAELPDRSTALAIYCLTGRMSADAVPTLRELGFTRITELAGGMQAWQADGRQLQG